VKKPMKFDLTSCVAALGLLALAGQAQASILTADLNVISVSDGSNGTNGTIAPPGTTLGVVTVTDYVDAALHPFVTVDVTFNPNTTLFVNTGGPHTPFAFNLNPAVATSAIINITPDLVPGPGVTFTPATSSGDTPFGTFSNGINGTFQNGGGHGVAGPLDFTITGITTANFQPDSLSYVFAADVLGPSGGTGAIANGDLNLRITPPTNKLGTRAINLGDDDPWLLRHRLYGLSPQEQGPEPDELTDCITSLLNRQQRPPQRGLCFLKSPKKVCSTKSNPLPPAAERLIAVIQRSGGEVRKVPLFA